MRRNLDRRSFLKSIGVGAAGLSLLPAVVSRAAEAPVPKRFIALLTANGTIGDAWVKSSTSETDFALGTILEPLAPFKKKLILLSGLDNLASYDGPGAAHQKGVGAFLTGAPLLDGDFGGGGDAKSGWASGISLDQRLANTLGKDTAFKSLELGVQVEGSNNRHRIAYAASNQPIAPDDSPASVFERLFGTIAASAGDQEAVLRRLRRRQSVLDFAENDLLRLKHQLGADEHERLEAHLESIRDVEKRLEMPTATCDYPTVPTGLAHKKIENYEKVGKLQSDLLAAAFACDLTRFATVLYGGGTSSKRFPALGFDDTHHTLSHAGNTDTAAKSKLIQINRFYAQQVAYLLQKLDSIPEGNGTVLDNTVVLWGNELSIGNTHSRKGLRWMLAGSAGGALKTGRYVQYSGVPHNNLLVSIARAVGLDLDTFGPSKYCTGALGKLT